MTSLSCSVCSLTFENKKEQFNHNGTILHHMILAEKSKGKSPHICSACNINASSYKSYLQHLGGQKHRKTIKQRYIESIGPDTSFESPQKSKKGKTSVFKNTVRNGNSSKHYEQKAKDNSDETVKDKNINLSNGEVILDGINNLYVLDTRKDITMDKNHSTNSYQRQPNTYFHQNRSYQNDEYYNQSYYQPYRYPYYPRGYYKKHRFETANWQRERYFNAIRREQYDDNEQERQVHEMYNNRGADCSSKNRNPDDTETRQNLYKPYSSDQCNVSSMNNNSTQMEISNDLREKSNVFSVSKRGANLTQSTRTNVGLKRISKLSASTSALNKNTAFQPLSTSKSKDINGRPIVKPVTSHLKYIIGKTSRPLPIRRISSNAMDAKLKRVSKKLPRSRSLSSEGSSNEAGLSSNNKLKEWSNGLPKVWPTMSSCDTDVINHLVNFPCTNKDRAALTCIIKEHSKSKKKLSYPRFNLPNNVTSSVSKNTFGGSYESMEKAVSDVINVLPDNVLNSLVNALDSDKEDHTDKSTLSMSAQSKSHLNSTNLSTECDSVCDSLSLNDSVVSNKRTRKTSQATKSPKKRKSDSFQILEKNNMNIETIQSTNCSENFPLNEDQSSVNQPSAEKSQTDLCNIEIKHETLEENSEQDAEIRTDSPSLSSPSSSMTNPSPTSKNNREAALSQSPLSNEQLDASKLLELLTEGSITVKSEFEDPIIETMKTFGSNIWDQVTFQETPGTQPRHCASPPRFNLSATNVIETDTTVQIPNSSVLISVQTDATECVPIPSASIPTQVGTAECGLNLSVPVPAQMDTSECVLNPSVPVSAHMDTTECVPNPSVPISAQMNTAECVLNPSVPIPTQATTTESVPNPSILEKSDCMEASEMNNKCLDAMPTKSDSTVLRSKLKELLEMNLEEEKLHKQFKETEHEICHLQEVLNNWITQKNEIHQKIINLGTRRHCILQQLQDTEEPKSNLENKQAESPNISRQQKESPNISHQQKELPSTSHQQKKSPNISHQQKELPSTSHQQKESPNISHQQKESLNISHQQKESPNLSHQQKELITTVKPETETASLKLTEDNVLLHNSKNTSPVATPDENKSSDDESVFIVSPVKSITTVPLIDIEDSSEDEATKVKHSNVKNQGVINPIERVCVNVDQLTAHKSTITCVTVFDGFLYTSSNDSLAKRFSLKNPSDTVEYPGHKKSVTSLCVSKARGHHTLFTSCYDGMLRSFNAELGTCLFSVELKCSILCMCRRWGKLFMGLHNGMVAVSLTSNGTIQNRFQCAKSSINRIVTATQGALRLLCIIAYDGVVTIWDASSGLLLRCLEGHVKPPSCIQVFDNSIYISSREKSLFIQDISSGKLQKMLSWPATTTGLGVWENYVISCSFDGLIRCYDKRNDFSLHCLYYGAGNEMITCMAIYKDWIFTGNRKGMVEAVKFNPNSLESCQFGHCYFKFGRKKDLMYHAALEHVRNMDKQCTICPWRSCSFRFLGTGAKVKESHIMGHFST